MASLMYSFAQVFALVLASTLKPTGYVISKGKLLSVEAVKLVKLSMHVWLSMAWNVELSMTGLR